MTPPLEDERHALMAAWLAAATVRFAFLDAVAGHGVINADRPAIRWECENRSVVLSWWPYGFETQLVLGLDDERAVEIESVPEYWNLVAGNELGMMSADASSMDAVLSALAANSGPILSEFLGGSASIVERALKNVAVLQRRAEAQQFWDRAVEAFRDRRWAESAAAFDDAAARYPDVAPPADLETKCRLARRHVERGD